MDFLAILPFVTELLRAFNAAQANKPAAEVKAEALVWWNIVKPFIKLVLTQDQIKALEAQGIVF